MHNPAQKGTVPGIVLDTKNLPWSILKEKLDCIVSIMILSQLPIPVPKLVQKLLKKLENEGQMGSFMKGFRFNLLDTLGKFEWNKSCKKLVSSMLKCDLLIWRNFAMETSHSLSLYALLEAHLCSH